MIAEKTADAIKGRKLTPFEPPTRIAGGMYNYDHNRMINNNKMPSPNAIYYKTLPPQAQYSTNSYDQPFESNIHRFGLVNDEKVNDQSIISLNSNNTIKSSYPIKRDIILGKENATESSAKKKQLYHKNDKQKQNHHLKQNQNEKFILNKYGSSIMADNFIKKTTLSPLVKNG